MKFVILQMQADREARAFEMQVRREEERQRREEDKERRAAESEKFMMLIAAMVGKKLE